MRKDDFVDLMGELDDEMLAEVQNLRQKSKKNKSRWLLVAALAASLALIITGVGLIAKPDQQPLPEPLVLQGQESKPDTIEPEKPETEPLPQLDAFPSTVTDRLQLLDFSGDAAETVTPSVVSYTVQKNLTNVINVDQFYLSEEEAALLEENMFFVSQGYGSEFFEIYERNRYDLVPNYVTVDSLMHTYHLYFSLLLNRTEKDYLAERLLNLSKALLNTSMSQREALAGTQWEAAAEKNVAFFAIAAVLQDKETEIPAYAAELVQAELEQIYAANGIAESPLAEDYLDYSQFKPRGYYEADEVLEPYFRAMMWYGQINFSQDNDNLCRSALLMTLAMAQSELLSWEQIYTVTSFFAGTSDDLGYYEYAPAIETAYGGFPSVEALVSDEDAYETYKNLIKELPPPAINSIPVYADEEGDLGEMNKGFRFMGQRFTMDAAIMQQLVYRAVRGEDKFGAYRLLPDTLDVAAALGSDTALRLLEEQGETEYEGYSENMSELRQSVSALREESWTTNLYSSWLYTLMPLLEEKEAGYPSYMTTEQWARKSLETFAGSYTELKHDTVLYAKQMMAEMGGGPPEERDDRGYVEPEPEVFRRFMLLSQQTAKGLNGFGLLSDADLENLGRLEELARRLMVIANKELRNELLTDEEYDLIREYGGTLEHFWLEAARNRVDAEYYDPREIPASLVTDIATDPNGRVLQVANGSPAEILVVVPVDGTLRLASGVVYDFYQFEQPINERLTDTQWRRMIGEWAGEDGYFHREQTPEKPWWTQDYWCVYENNW